jgi:hypothetical protein
MPSVNIFDAPPIFTVSVKTSGALNANISEKKYNSIISEDIVKTKSVKQVDYAIVKISYRSKKVRVDQKLPFYVKFENIGVSAYGPSNPAPIGIAVIGFNNYIL